MPILIIALLVLGLVLGLPLLLRPAPPRPARPRGGWRRLLADTWGGFPPAIQLDLGAVPNSPNNTVIPVLSSNTPDIPTIDVPTGAGFDTTAANALKISPLGPGFLFFVKNRQATAIRVISSATDPGVIVQAGDRLMLSVEGLASGAGGGGIIQVGTSIFGGGQILFPAGAGIDDGVRITAALKVGDVQLASGLNYNINSPIDFSTALGVLYGNDATATGSMAATGTNHVLKALPVLAGTGNTTVTAAPVIGQNTIAVTAVAGALVAGAVVQLQHSLSANVVEYLRVKRVNVLTLTLERPVSLSFDAAATVKPCASIPQQPTVYDLRITGTGDRAVDFQAAFMPYLDSITVDTSGGALTLGGIVMDLGCYDPEIVQCEVSGLNAAGTADVFDLGLAFLGCVRGACRESAGRHATVAGVFVRDCAQTVLQNVTGSDCATATAAGIAVSGTSAASSNSFDVLLDGCLGVNCDIGIGVALAVRLVARKTIARNSATKGWDIGPATAPTDCLFLDCVHDGGACATNGILVSATTVRPTFQNLLAQNQTGATVIFQINCDAIVRGFTSLPTNTTTGPPIRLDTATGDTNLQDVRITLKTVNAATQGILVNSPGRVYLKNVFVGLGVANETGINQSSNGIVELDDIVITNPGGGGATFGFIANGATSVTRRKGRVDCSATNTPLTFVQTDQLTMTANGAAAVDNTFKDARAGGGVWATVQTGAGAVARTPAGTVTAASKFTITSIAGDTSVYNVKYLD